MLPWGILNFCVAHPTGHNHHHEPGEVTPCEMRKLYKGSTPVVWPPMECYHFLVDTDDFHTVNNIKTLPTSSEFELVEPNYTNGIEINIDVVLFPPEPRCRSATICGLKNHRAPPLSILIV